MTRRTTTFLFAVWVLIGAVIGQARAGVIFSIDMDTSVGGIQTTRTVSPGANFDVGLHMSVTGSTTVSLYGLRVSFDTSESSVTLPANLLPTGWSTLAGPTVTGDTVGIFNGYSTLGEPFPFLDSSYSALIGTMKINAVNPTTGGSFDFTPMFGSGDAVFDKDNNIVSVGDISFQGGSINAVPEPGTILLTSLGLGFVAFRRYRKSRSAAKPQ